MIGNGMPMSQRRMPRPKVMFCSIRIHIKTVYALSRSTVRCRTQQAQCINARGGFTLWRRFGHSVATIV
jgi:hypothetical protein